jgi:hypothetical protein
METFLEKLINSILKPEIPSTHWNVGLEVNLESRDVEGVGDVAVEFGMLLVVDLFRLHQPQRLNEIQLCSVEENRAADEVAVLLHDVANFVFVGILAAFWLEVNNNFCANVDLLALLNFK